MDSFLRTVLPEDPHDRRLLDRVRPSGYSNPTPKPRYDLVVVGAGTAGLVSAAGAAGLGARVALVERNLLGGDCLNHGCVPSKAMLAPAQRLADIAQARNLGIDAQGQADFAQVMERLRRLRADISRHDSVERFTGLGVDVFLGEGRFTGSDRIQVGSATLPFHKAFLATGARAILPDIPGLASARVYTNETIFTLTQRPGRLAVLGAGPIGCEMTQAFARLGTEVYLISRDPRVLPRDDTEAAGLVEARLRQEGVRLHSGTTLARVETQRQEASLFLENGTTFTVDAILVAAGRKANTEGLDLDAAGIKIGSRGIEVDDTLRTSNRRVYSLGDAIGQAQFTHAADAMARLAIRNAFFPGKGRLSGLIIPWCTYCDPEVAQVGLSEESAQAAKTPVDVYRVNWDEVDRAVLAGTTEGFIKVLTAKGRDRILGATVVGGPAGDVIGAFSLAMKQGLGLGKLATAIYPYPTLLEVLRKLGDQYNRTRLTPFTRGVLKTWLRWGWW